VGNIYVENLLTLNASANVKGDIFTQKLVIESGAIFIADVRWVQIFLLKNKTRK